MKTLLILTGLWFSLSLGTALAQVVKDPFLDYYQFTKSGDSLGDDEPHYSPKTQVYYFEAELTSDNRKSILITDDESQQGAHGMYGWSVYYPLVSGGYEKVPFGISMDRSGPDFIGYIDQIKRLGLIIGTRDSVAAYYLDNGAFKSKAIDVERGHADAKHYQKYFPSSRPWQIQKTTVAQLAQKYGQ